MRRRNLARHKLLQALAQISPEHREILIFKDVQGLPYAAIARRLGVPEDSVADRLFQARRAFLEPWTALRPAAGILCSPFSVPALSAGAAFPPRKDTGDQGERGAFELCQAQGERSARA